MGDEIYHPVVTRNLFRQSSIETPLSPSIPSDSDSEDDHDQKSHSGTQSTKEDVALTQDDNKPATNPSSIGKLRDRFQNVGLIKMKNDTDAAIGPEKEIRGSDKQAVQESKASKEKPKPAVKPKTVPKKNLPVAPGRSDSLVSKIAATNALLNDELQGRFEKSGPVIVGEDLKVRNVSENDQKVEQTKPEIEKKKKPDVPKRSPETSSPKKDTPPPTNKRSDSLQQNPQSPPTPMMEELRRKMEISTDQTRAHNQLENVPEVEIEAEYNVPSEDDDKTMHPGKSDRVQSVTNVSTIKALPVMASPRPKSPRPVPVSAKKDEKEESFWEKIGTLGRKKRIKEVQEVQEEGKYAIDSPGLAANPDMPPEDYTLDENEERSMMEPRALEDPKLQELIYVLIEWINDELADQRIIVKDIAEDLYDGQVLQKLLERLTGRKLDVPEVTQSEEGQKQKLAVVLSAANRVLDRYPPYKWSVDSVHSKNIVSILHLLVGLARQFRAPVRLPERVAVQVVVVRKKDGQLVHRTIREEITSTYEDLGMRCERDAFDTLFDHAPEKLAVVKKSLVSFVNKHLSKVHLEVTELDTQFHDGVFLTLLLGLLEGFFVPLGSFHLTPKTHDQKVHNVSFAFDLMQEIGLVKPKARPEDIVNLDLKSTLRVLYNLFTKYKGMN